MLAETVIGLFKTEIYRRDALGLEPWKGLEDVELAALEGLAWYKRAPPSLNCSTTSRRPSSSRPIMTGRRP
jgi:hypothetical protein